MPTAPATSPPCRCPTGWARPSSPPRTAGSRATSASMPSASSGRWPAASRAAGTRGPPPSRSNSPRTSTRRAARTASPRSSRSSLPSSSTPATPRTRSFACTWDACTTATASTASPTQPAGTSPPRRSASPGGKRACSPAWCRRLPPTIPTSTSISPGSASATLSTAWWPRTCSPQRRATQCSRRRSGSSRPRPGAGRWARPTEQVRGLAAGQHLDEPADALRSRLGARGVAEAVEDGVAAGTLERLEERRSLWIGLQGRRQVVGDGGGALRLVRLGPPAVGFRPLDLGEAGGPHVPGGDECLGLPAVDPGPLAAGTAGREALEPPGLVVGALLAVDPSVAEGDVEGLGVGDGVVTRSRLGNLEPQTLRGVVVGGEPRAPGGLGGKGQDRQALAVGVGHVTGGSGSSDFACMRAILSQPPGRPSGDVQVADRQGRGDRCRGEKEADGN